MSEWDSLEIEDVHHEFEAYGGDPGACKAQLAAGKAGSGVELLKNHEAEESHTESFP